MSYDKKLTDNLCTRLTTIVHNLKQIKSTNAAIMGELLEDSLYTIKELQWIIENETDYGVSKRV